MKRDAKAGSASQHRIPAPVVNKFSHVSYMHWPCGHYGDNAVSSGHHDYVIEIFRYEDHQSHYLLSTV